MKILHVCESSIGGTGSYLDILIPALQNHYGQENIALLSPRQHMDHLNAATQKSAIGFNRPNRKTGLVFLAFAYIRAVVKFRPDVIHVHSTFAGIITRMLFPLFFRIPIIYCPHGWAMDMEQSSTKKRVISFVEKTLSLFCKKIIAISETENKTGQAVGIRADKIVTIYNGVPAQAPEYTPVAWDDERIRLVFVGRFDQQKGIDILLEALAPLGDKITARIIGGAVNDQVDIDYDQYPHIEFVGWKTIPEVAAYMASGDVVVVPSRWEGFGLVAIEAMRVSKAVIASRTGGLAEIVIDQDTGFLIPPKDVAALRACFTALEKDTLQKMGQKGKERFLSTFTSDRMIAEIISLYAENE